MQELLPLGLLCGIARIANHIDAAASKARELSLPAEERWLDLIWEQLYAIANDLAPAADLNAIEKLTHDSMRSAFDVLGNGETVLAVMLEVKPHLRSA